MGSTTTPALALIWGRRLAQLVSHASGLVIARPDSMSCSTT